MHERIKQDWRMNAGEGCIVNQGVQCLEQKTDWIKWGPKRLGLKEPVWVSTGSVLANRLGWVYMGCKPIFPHLLMDFLSLQSKRNRECSSHSRSLIHPYFLLPNSSLKFFLVIPSSSSSFFVFFETKPQQFILSFLKRFGLYKKRSEIYNFDFYGSLLEISNGDALLRRRCCLGQSWTPGCCVCEIRPCWWIRPRLHVCGIRIQFLSSSLIQIPWCLRRSGMCWCWLRVLFCATGSGERLMWDCCWGIRVGLKQWCRKLLADVWRVFGLWNCSMKWFEGLCVCVVRLYCEFVVGSVLWFVNGCWELFVSMLIHSVGWWRFWNNLCMFLRFSEV